MLVTKTVYYQLPKFDLNIDVAVPTSNVNVLGSHVSEKNVF